MFRFATRFIKAVKFHTCATKAKTSFCIVFKMAVVKNCFFAYRQISRKPHTIA